MAVQPRPPLRGDRANGTESSGLGDDWRRAQTEARSLGSAVADVTEEIRKLVRLEGELAAAEVSEAAAAARQAGMWGGVAALFGVMVVVFLGLSIMFALWLVVDLWIAALITTAIMALVAGIAAMLMRNNLKNANPVPRRTMESIQEDMKWAREQMKRRSA